jgi:hypothetical protein
LPHSPAVLIQAINAPHAHLAHVDHRLAQARCRQKRHHRLQRQRPHRLVQPSCIQRSLLAPESPLLRHRADHRCGSSKRRSNISSRDTV